MRLSDRVPLRIPDRVMCTAVPPEVDFAYHFPRIAIFAKAVASGACVPKNPRKDCDAGSKSASRATSIFLFVPEQLMLIALEAAKRSTCCHAFAAYPCKVSCTKRRIATKLCPCLRQTCRRNGSQQTMLQCNDPRLRRANCTRHIVCHVQCRP